MVINDGSTDNTFEVCQNLSLSDNRIRIINKSNSGPGESRNVGIGSSLGDFLLFVDSDDILENYAVEILIQRILQSGVDLISFNYSVWSDKREVSRLIVTDFSYPTVGFSSGKKCLDYIFKGKISNFAWSFFYRKSILTNSDINFPSDILIFEDAVFLNRLLRHVTSVEYVQAPLYRYTIGENDSLTSSIDTNKAVGGLRAIQEIIGLAIADECLADAANHIFRLLLFIDTLVDDSDQFSMIVHRKIRITLNKLFKMAGFWNFTFDSLIKMLLIKLHLYSYLKKLYLSLTKSNGGL